MTEQNRPWFHWQTSIAWKNKDRIVVRGYDVNELTGNIDFGEMLHLVLTGELPTPEVGKVTNALMVNLAEHAMSPSSATVRFATSGGAELNAAVAAGVAEIGRAMEDATVGVFNGRRLYLNGPGSMACVGLDAGYEPLQLKAMFIVCRSLSLAAHSIEESQREKGWRASGNAGMIQPLSLEMQGPDWYD